MICASLSLTVHLESKQSTTGSRIISLADDLAASSASTPALFRLLSTHNGSRPPLFGITKCEHYLFPPSHCAFSPPCPQLYMLYTGCHVLSLLLQRLVERCPRQCPHCIILSLTPQSIRHLQIILTLSADRCLQTVVTGVECCRPFRIDA